MNKKYIKIINHLYKNLQKKDEFKKEFEKNSDLIFLYSFGLFFTIFFVFFSFIFGTGMPNFFVSLVVSILLGFYIELLFLILKIKIFNIFVDKKLSKYNLFNLYGRNSTFDNFLSNIIEDIIKNTEKELLKPYIKEITHIINSIPDKSIKHNIKIKIIEKMEIDVDSQLIDLIEHKIEEKNMIKIDCKSIVVNN